MSTSIPARTRTARHALALVVVMFASLLPTAADAGRPTTSTSSGADISCEVDNGFLGIFVSEEEDGFTFVDLFYESFDGGDTLYGFGDDATFDGTTLSATVEVVAEGGADEPEPVGVATIEAVLDPVGEPEVFEDRFRDGNIWVTIREVFVQTDVAGSATLDGVFDVDLSTCVGSLVESTFTSTNPAAYNNRYEGRFLDCAAAGDDGIGFVFADSSRDGEFLDVYVVDGDGVEVAGFTEDVVFTDTALQGRVDLFEVETGMPDGTAMVDASLASTGSFTNDFRARGVRISETVEEFDVTGTVVVDGTTYVLEDCFAVAFEGKEHYGSPQGPKGGGGGRLPANDLPEDAVLLAIPSSTTVRTGAASPAPEAACSFVVEDEGEPFEIEVPLGNTVWYAFEGTGEPVTVDTSGTEFDTVVGIYDADLQQLACVDDVESGSFTSLQAAATIDTAAGETYLVQVGGFGYFEDGGEIFPADSGRLRVTIR